MVQVRDAIRAQIVAGQFKPGDRLPSEARLTQDFGVSRTVVREAVAALRSDGLVEPRQGAGVFVLTPPSEEAQPRSCARLVADRNAGTANGGRRRSGGTCRAARSPAQEEKIIEAFERFCDLARRGEPTSEADFAFHTVIAGPPTTRASANFCG